MRFGAFDQNDLSGRVSTAVQYEERLQLAELYEKSGFYCYHMSEHHGTPLSTTPSPSVFLAAMSQRTKTLRFGPLVYLLPAYNPLRLAEEISMLDNLSNGRFEFGVGRGASPHEMGYLGVSSEDMQPMYHEAEKILHDGLIHGVLNHKGTYWSYDNVELSIRPVQRPRPAMWVAMGGNPDSAVWPARYQANIVVGAPAAKARPVFQRYIEEAKSVPDSDLTSVCMGLNRFIIVGESDETAEDLGHRAWGVFYSRFIKLWARHGGTPGNRLPESFSQLLESGFAVAGSARKVRETLASQIEESGANFLSGTFVFGDMSLQESSGSIQRFALDVMPALSVIGEAAHERLLKAA